MRALAYSNRFVRLWRDPPLMVYLGDHGDYLLVDGHYCSCPGFTMRTSRRGVAGCTHVYAVRIALREGRFRDLSGSLSPGDVAAIVWEVLTGGLAVMVRRMLALEDHVGDDYYGGEDG
ncbi:MAG: hypothetical protein F7C38_03505 [Desulfurococcales archaeon]|nr:hypothetical protein [Desulfurococcales archaeon]